ALVLTGHWETGLESGALTQGALFTAIRSAANPGTTGLTGDQILEFLRAALKPENAVRQPRELRGRPVGTPHVAGARVCYSNDLEQIDVEINGKPLERRRRYIVASTDVELSDYTNYLVIPSGEIEFEVPTIMPEVLEDHITKYSPVRAPGVGRIVSK
ncbi:MAG TPA: 5'-nucleotidase C-terminal domain-containing protein, partial [Anaerolineales bacterium]|nr:5'-nucleotidase C-terminal domain-containing protein [Anaerolineales bacterium]